MIKIFKSDEISDKDLLSRDEVKEDVYAVVADIIRDVRESGDAALYKYSQKFDKVKLSALEVSKSEKDAALKSMEAKFKKILNEASRNIWDYHSRQVQRDYVVNKTDGVLLGQKIIPLERVGLYVPGGTASYVSSVLMNCIPAKIAGVDEIIMTTPPDKNGNVNSDILAAAEIAGVNRVFKIGGAQAVAALAFGTESVPKADKIVGPGNVYVTEAKRQVYGIVDIDMIAGPSEILVIADEESDPEVVAADMLSQAEHDELSAAVLVTNCAKLAKDVAKALEVQLKTLPRQKIARASIENKGKIIITSTIDEAIDIANKLAPEHLELCVDEPFAYLNRIRNAGSIFLGRYCPEPLGDYFAGTNHTLPTGGTARFSSPLSVDDFVKKSSYLYYSKNALNKVGKKVAYFAEREGLSAHARSVTIRMDKG